MESTPVKLNHKSQSQLAIFKVPQVSIFIILI